MDADAIRGNATPGKGQPEKRIRTFASDMEILKKGGTPIRASLAAMRPEPLVSIPEPIQEANMITQNAVSDTGAPEKFIRTFSLDT